VKLLQKKKERIFEFVLGEKIEKDWKKNKEEWRI